MSNSYVLTFRGDVVARFTSVYDEQHVRLAYIRRWFPGQTPHEVPAGAVGTVPCVIRRMKTAAALRRDTVPPEFRTYPGQHFMVRVLPGTTEITDTEEVR